MLPHRYYKAPTRGPESPKLNGLEQRIYDLRMQNEAKYFPHDNANAKLDDLPPMSDADLDDLRDMTPTMDQLLVRAITEGRRESGSFLRLRKIFYKS